MGWFNDSDSDDESQKRRKRPLLETFHDDANDDNGVNVNADNLNQTQQQRYQSVCKKSKNDQNKEEREMEEKEKEEEEEVDPLDAFMNNLSSSSSSFSKKKKKNQLSPTTNNTNSTGNNNYDSSKKQTRMDMDNEEEATAHWELPTASSSSASASAPSIHMHQERKSEIQHQHQHQQQSKNHSTNPSIKNNKAIHQSAMENIFHKAGEKSKLQSNPNNNNTNYNDYNDDEHDYITHMQKQKDDDREHYQMDKINHSYMMESSTYKPFCKVFLNPTIIHGLIYSTRWDSNSMSSGTYKGSSSRMDFGNEWRIKHHVTCSIDYIDPIESFQQYSGTHNSSNDQKTSISNNNTNNFNNNMDKQQQLQQRDGIFDDKILTYLEKNNFRKATLVQAQSIPVALCGKDLIVTSHTGSGKTLAYLLPLVVHVLDQPHIQPKVDGPIAIILTPTRELAKQVHAITKKLLSLVNGKAVSVTGGMGTYEMTKELQKGCEVIISTPGRLIDMVKKKATNFLRVTFVVLDEADKMLDMGFEKQVCCILDSIRPDRQTLMFSATFGKRVERVAKSWLSDPVRIAVGRTGSSSDHVDQQVLVLPSYESKKIWLTEMLPTLAGIGKTIIFVSSKADCETVAQLMKDDPNIGGNGLLVDSIHGDKHQSDRNAALASLRKGRIAALVATDVASRGLDVDDIQTVINFDAAKNLDSHVHRIGRAGRLNRKTPESEHRKGVAYTLLTSKNAEFARILVEAFEREGREVGHDLLNLAMKSKHYGGGGRTKWNKAGLGFCQE